MSTPTNEAIVHFVRDTLGCNCPDEVFKQIDFTRPPSSDNSPHVSIVIGERLLIYIYEMKDDEFISDATFESLIQKGLAQRDSSGLNRFRLVIATADPDTVLTAISSAFESSTGKDEKAHLHVIDIHVPALLALLT